MKKCKSANRYTGKLPPRCNGGDPCDACKAKYAAHAEFTSVLGIVSIRKGRKAMEKALKSGKEFPVTITG